MSPTAGPLRRQTLIALCLLALAALTAIATGCGPVSVQASDHPPMTIATGLWPLQQVATAIGGRDVEVTDVVPSDADPLRWRPSAAARQTIAHADVVLEMGRGFQPGFERAATHNAQTTALTPPLKLTDPYVWLSPARMISVARLVYTALAMRSPDDVPVLRQGLTTLVTQLERLSADYTARFHGCPAPTVVTVDRAFGVLHQRYGVRLRVLDPEDPQGPSVRMAPSTVDTTVLQTQVRTIRHSGARTIFNESGLPASYLAAASRASGARVDTLDTMLRPPAGRETYLGALRSNLRLLARGMTCGA